MGLMPAVAALAALAALGYWYMGANRRPAPTRPIRMRWWVLILVGLAGQLLLPRLSLAMRGLVAAADCGAVGLWCVLNRRSKSGLSGLVVLAAGCSLNCLVIAANGGMPVSRWALGRAGLSRGMDVSRGHLDKHVVLTASSRLRALGDIIPIPGLRTVVSGGDVLMLAGIAAAVFTAVVTALPARSRSSSHQPPSVQKPQMARRKPPAPSRTARLGAAS